MDKVENFKKNIFDAIAVDNIVWIDDRFSESNNSIVKEYIAELKAIYDSDLVDLVSEFDAFNGINFQLPYFELIEPSIPKDDMTIGRFYEHINKEVPDFTRSQFDDLIGIFNGVVKKGVYKYTFRQWSENKNTHFKNDKECYLYLVDYNFEAEGLGSDYGKEIIKDILSCSNPGNNYCVLFTSEINRGQQEEDKRKEIISDFSENGNIIDTHGFSVLAKSIIAPTENVCLGFKSAEFIKRIFLRKPRIQVRSATLSNLSG